ncbi:DUF4306 domain-containing protein [Jeotgalibacillus proteolyticus]|uniref:DUF4306 domain-containing protein n=1 Tax=Jeotgalibacillus proteolyticus TaxID=2082395 RepID=A0A2S5GCR2_9BACL|nr:DUF4306 domain-containing protein [Jeotgalibacillus proteolyticus]PPA70822.1 hypothetical protein C4B60_08495 [Jeotgalibacillus proteolyticus]
MFKMTLKTGVLMIILAIAAFAAWVDGSALLDDPWDWQHTALFSQFFHGSISAEHQISQLDFFLYSAKFRPFYPVLMIISSLGLIVLSAYHLLKKEPKRFAYFLFVMSAGAFALSYGISSSPTVGGFIFFLLWLASGILFILSAAWILRKGSFRQDQVNA